MTLPLDYSLYPDLDEPPDDLPDDYAKADYLHRVCTAWDFGIMPDPETFVLLANWRGIFDHYPVLTSPGYHTFRQKYGWPEIPWPKGIKPPMPRWEKQDQIEGRGPDPCENKI